MTTSRFSAGASRFAHFAGLARGSRRAADDDEQDEPKGKKGRASEEDDDEDEPKGKRSRASEEDQDEPKGKKGRASEEDDDEDEPKSKRSRASDDDDEDEDEQPKARGRRSRAEEDDDDGEDDDDREMNGRGAVASARRREQSRIAHILGHSAAANNLPLAISLACETRMPRRDAVAVLRGQAGNRRDRDDDREPNRHARSDRARRNVNLGSDAEEPNGKQGVKSSWAATWDKLGIKAG